MNKAIPDPFTIDEIRFRTCFSAPSYRIFVALVIGWALTVGKHTVSRVIVTMRLHESRRFATHNGVIGPAAPSGPDLHCRVPAWPTRRGGRRGSHHVCVKEGPVSVNLGPYPNLEFSARPHTR